MSETRVERNVAAIGVEALEFSSDRSLRARESFLNIFEGEEDEEAETEDEEGEEDKEDI